MAALSGLGRQICWDAANRFGGKFTSVNFASEKHDIGFALMNQLATTQKRFPKADQDIAADFFALRKSFQGNRWVFSEGRNALNPASHCDIAWSGGLATLAHAENNHGVRAVVLMEDGSTYDGSNMSPQELMMRSNDPRIWTSLSK